MGPLQVEFLRSKAVDLHDHARLNVWRSLRVRSRTVMFSCVSFLNIIFHEMASASSCRDVPELTQ